MAAGILLGAIIGAHGMKGEVKVKTFTETPGRLGAYGPLHDKTGRAFTVAAIRVVDAGVAVVRFEGVSDRNASEALKGTELFVAREALPQPESEEFYHADLIGLRAEDAEGRKIGQVRGVHNFGAGDVLELEKPDGSDALLPFTREFVPRVEIAEGRVIVAVPAEVDTEMEADRDPRAKGPAE
jgi:16S rRNA processing protein RimM